MLMEQSLRLKDGLVYVGCVARDGQRKFIEAISMSKPGRTGLEMVEIIGVKEALSWIKRKGWTNVAVETDCIVVVQEANGTVKLLSNFGLLIQDYRMLLSSLSNVSLHYAKRSANRAAHCVARGSCLRSDCHFDELDTPAELINIVMSESSSS